MPALRPVAPWCLQLEVDQPGYSPGRRVAQHMAIIGRPGSPLQRNHPWVCGEPFGLRYHAVAARQAEHLQCRRVEPGMVEVAVDQDNREVRAGGIELCYRHLAPPGAGPMPCPYQELAGPPGSRGLRDEGEHVL